MAGENRHLADGGAELDMVVNIGRVRDEAWDVVTDEIRQVLAATREGGQTAVSSPRTTP